MSDAAENGSKIKSGNISWEYTDGTLNLSVNNGNSFKYTTKADALQKIKDMLTETKTSGGSKKRRTKNKRHTRKDK